VPTEEEYPASEEAQSADEGPARRRRESRWLLIVLGSAIAVVGVGAVLIRVTGEDASTDRSSSESATAQEEQGTDGNDPGQDIGADLPTRLRAELSALATRDLEQASPSEHAHHGHHVEDEGSMLCVVKPFGIDPPDATRVTDVEQAYLQHMCVSAEPGRPWDFSPKTSGPLVYLPGDPPRKAPKIIGLRPGGHDTEQVRELIPSRYHEQAFAPFPDQELFDYLRKRFDAVVR